MAELQMKNLWKLKIVVCKFYLDFILNRTDVNWDGNFESIGAISTMTGYMMV